VDRLDDLEDDAVEFPASDPLRELETQSELSQMHVAIGNVSVRHQEVWVLKYKDDLSYKEIAEVMGLTSTNVGFILHEAMRFLRNVSGEQEDVLAKRNYGD
jgi:RNA polymerase sigma-70 factor (ECF subfamily)